MNHFGSEAAVSLVLGRSTVQAWNYSRRQVWCRASRLVSISYMSSQCLSNIHL